MKNEDHNYCQSSFYMAFKTVVKNYVDSSLTWSVEINQSLSNLQLKFTICSFTQVIDEYERAKSLYGETDSEIFQKYLDEIEKRIGVLKTQLTQKLREEDLPVEQQKKFIGILVQVCVLFD